MATNTVKQSTVRRLVTPVERFIKTESSSGIVLIAVALIAFLWANSPFSDSYFAMKDAPTGIELGAWELKKPLVLWVNDLLMAIFFFLVGLEIKRELLVGELAGWQKASLPMFGALGGMVAPALIYLVFNAGTEFSSGWGVPMATDIAFAVGVLALLGPRVPLTLKVFLLALAIVDDLGAVMVIALFYTAELSVSSLVISLLIWLVAVYYGKRGGGHPLVYTVLGLIVWYFMLKSGVHATIAGVLMAFAVPLVHPIKPEELKKELRANIGGDFEAVEMRLEHLERTVKRAQSPLHNFEHDLVPYVAFFIMPVFALFNAGVSLAPAEGASLVSTATFGVIFGLLLGKPIGIVGLVYVAVLLRLTKMPKGLNWTGLTGISLLAAIGFTMALFIANLAFETPEALDQAKIGVLAASVVAAFAGLFALKKALPKEPAANS